ncbi:hypothetical protein L207DRAFT_506605 [Hyaloscypha variabilis F]|uniref:F-box domain-containing protein n=1 Tax=Hyaloscypha variabilis (strain UAMH 11265 / GT02V1 / F) TaxID=1149755 RepID=A0A2J6SA27_HYAVF|nr:hypothetical protein L207DRAFT_506605 [Hyaloscypha variabilis F]
MSGNPTLSPTCSLNIQIFTPATSPIAAESHTADATPSSQSLRGLYQAQESRKDDYAEYVERTVAVAGTRPPLITMTKRLPKLVLDIPRAVTTPRDYDAGDTTTPPLSPESESEGSRSENKTRQEYLNHTLHSITRRPKLALNIPPYPSRAVRSPADAGETTTPPLSPQYHPKTAQNLSPHEDGHFKLTRRSLNSPSEQKPTLINLHPYIQALIIHCLAQDSWLDKYSLRATCRRFCTLIGPPRPDGFDRFQWSHLKSSFLSCKDCLRLRPRAEFVDNMRYGSFRPGGSAAGERYCIDCGLKSQVVEGRRIPPRLRKRTRLKVDDIEWVVCVYCGQFGEAPTGEETWFRDCCRACLVGGTGSLGGGVVTRTTSVLRGSRVEKVLNGSPAVQGDAG